MGKIRHIIFDLGNVIINVDTEATMKSIARRGITNLEKIQPKLLASDTYYKLETGAISPDDFRAAIREAVDVPYSDGEIDEDWNAMLLDIPPERVKFMTRLPLGRLGKPDEVARISLVLASDFSEYVTGAVIPVDGGFLSA